MFDFYRGIIKDKLWLSSYNLPWIYVNSNIIQEIYNLPKDYYFYNFFHIKKLHMVVNFLLFLKYLANYS